MIYRFEIDLEADDDDDAKKELEARILAMAVEIEETMNDKDTFEPTSHGRFYLVQ